MANSRPLVPDVGGEPRRWVTRGATVDDAERIAAFHLACWKDAYRQIVPDSFLDRMDVDGQAARWRTRIGEGARQVAAAVTVEADAVVSERGDTPARDAIVGVVSWGNSHDRPEPSLPQLELASLYVSRPLWGSGAAASLLHLALASSCAHLWVFEENRRARFFYVKHGFAPDGVRKIDGRTGVWECRFVRR